MAHALLVSGKKLSGNERKKRFFLHRMETDPSFFVKGSMEFLLGQKLELIFEKRLKGGPYDVTFFL